MAASGLLNCRGLTTSLCRLGRTSLQLPHTLRQRAVLPNRRTLCQRAQPDWVAAQDLNCQEMAQPSGSVASPMRALSPHPCGSPTVSNNTLPLSPKRARPNEQHLTFRAPSPQPIVQQQQLMSQQQPAIGAFSPVGYGADLGKALKSVCKVFATTASPNYATPWQMHAQSKSTASGFVIAPISQRRILTNAHAVANQVQVQLRKHGNAKKFTAKVLSVGHECDIAMLTVEDEEFWTGVEALDIGGLPGMQESVSVVGYPTGGDNVCVTKGVVSRIDRQQYSHGRTSLLALQIDAAINSGNSGGPVIKGDKVIGIAFQCLTQGENIGYVIPVPVIHHFLEDLARHNGRYTGFCELGASWQTLESADHKLALHMPPSLTGVFITSLEPTYYAAQVLRPGDVITHFNGHSIADDGTFLFEHAQHVHPALSNRGSLTTTMLPALSLSALPDSVDTLSKDAPSVPSDMAMSLTLDRPRAQPSLTASATSLGRSSPFSTNASPAAALTAKSHPFAAPQLVPVHSHDEKPHYFIFGGLVFTRLTNFYLRSTYGVDWTHKAPIKLCDRSFAGFLEHEGQECVILSKVLAWDCNAGYQDLGNVEVMTVAGVRVHSLEHLAHLLDNAPGPYVRLDLQWHKVVLLDVRKARAAAADILAQNCIPGNGSYPKDLAKRALNLPPHLALATDKALGRLPAVAPLDEVPLLAAPKPSTSTSSAVSSGQVININGSEVSSGASSKGGQSVVIIAPPPAAGVLVTASATEPGHGASTAHAGAEQTDESGTPEAGLAAALRASHI
ncbi:hypothetical protein V8C86DRAFT_116654 [Haematococcus lacustris]